MQSKQCAEFKLPSNQWLSQATSDLLWWPFYSISQYRPPWLGCSDTALLDITHFSRGSLRESITIIHWVMAEVNLGPEKKAELSCWTGTPRDLSGQPSSLPGKSLMGVEDGASTEIHARSTPLSHKSVWRITPNQSLCQMSCHSEASQCQCPNIYLRHLLSWLGSQPPLY